MPKYYAFMIAGYYLYFTSHCVVEAMHVHASNRGLQERGSAKFYVRKDGSSRVERRGMLTDREVSRIQDFIQDNYEEMYLTWRKYSSQSYFEGE